MAISFSFSSEQNYLLVKVNGYDESLDDVLNYTNAVITEMKQTDYDKILCDERDVVYNISISDTFQLAEYVSQFSYASKKVAIVCHSKFYESVKFYEDVAVNRGFNIAFFKEIYDAEEWLMN